MPPRPRARMPGRKCRVSCVSARTLRSSRPQHVLGRVRVERARQTDAGVVDEHVGVGAVRGESRVDGGDRLRRGDVDRNGDGLDRELGADVGRRLLQRTATRRATSITSLPAAANRRASSKPMPSEPPVTTTIGRRPAKAASAAGSGRHQRRRQACTRFWIGPAILRCARALAAALKDMGFNKGQAHWEASRSFWDVPLDRMRT